MDLDDIFKIEIEQNWKFTQLVVGLSLGILAFSLQLDERDFTYCYMWMLYLSWGFFFVAFTAGMCRLFLFLKIKTKESQQLDDKSNKNEKIIYKYDRSNRVVAYILLISFILGVTSLVLFKLFDLLHK